MTNELYLNKTKKKTTRKIQKLIISLFFDAVGMLSYIIPGAGEFIDIVWAPISGFLLTKMYKGNTGKVAGIISFIEESIPGLDFIPTFTLTWLYTYVLNKKE